MPLWCNREWGTPWHPCLALAFVVFVLVPSRVSPHLNLFLSKSEVRKLIGLDAELYYVRDGVANTYALNFTVPVAANLSKLHFNWQGLLKKPMPYLALIEYDNGEAMALPTLNISSKGIVPTNISTFSLTLPCSGASNAEVQVNLHLNVTSSSKKSESNVTNLTIRRKKICLKGDTFLPQNEQIYQPPSLFVAMGIASTATVFILTLASLVYLKLKKEKEKQSINSRYYSGPSYLGVGNSSTIEGMRIQQGGAAHSMRSNSYATIASLKKFPLHSSSPTQEAFEVHRNGSNSFLGSLHYASSPLSHLYSHRQSLSQKRPQRCSPSNSLINSRLSQNSWCSPSTLRSHSSWRDPRVIDPTERIKQLTVDRWRVVVGDLLQEGTFGRIHQGLCHDPLTQKALNVIVKTVSGDSSSSQAHLVLREGLLLFGLRHQNLLPVLGVCTQDPRRPLLLYPHQEQTNLKLYLRGNKNKGVNFEGKKLLTRDAVQVAIGVCQGLIYMHQQKILHKDVATRNCLVDKDLQARVTDTALSRDLFPHDYHCLGDNENRPIKWLSLEAVIHKKFSPANDVWMFGVLLWELMTSAQQPYIEIDPFEMEDYLRDGYRLSQPHSCPDDLFGVMAICWAPSPEDRPTLDCLNTCLQEFHTALSTFV